MAEDFQLRFLRQPPLRGAPKPRRGLGARGHKRQRHQSLRPVRPVDEARRDLACPVPAAQYGTGRASLVRRAFECHPVRALKLCSQLKLELPAVEPVLPVHYGVILSLPIAAGLASLLIAWY